MLVLGIKLLSVEEGFGDYQTNPDVMSSHCLEIREMWEPEVDSHYDSVTHNTRYQGSGSGISITIIIRCEQAGQLQQ